MEKKLCNFCEKTKPVAEFSMKKGKPQGRCKLCFSAYQKKYYEDNPDKYEALKSRVNATRPKYNKSKARAKMYGLTVEELEELLLSNSGMCWCCGVKQAIAVDHCHETNRVRGMLCNGCNLGLGLLGDTVEGLQKAIDYLRINDDSTVEVPR